MHNIDTEGNASGTFTDGDPMTSTPATVVDDDWLNAVQGEIVNAIQDSGGPALVKGNNNQLITRLKALFGRLSVANTWAEAQKFLQRSTFVTGIQFGSGPSYPNYLDQAGSGTLVDVATRNLSASVSMTAPAYTYSSVQVMYAYVDPAEFQAGTAANVSLSTTGSTASVSAAGATPASVRARVRIPLGATITALDICAGNVSAGTLTISAIELMIIEDASGSTAPTYTNYVTGTSMALAASAPKQWRNAAMSSTPTLPVRGWVELAFLLPGSTALGVYAARVGYTMAAVAPQ